MNEKLENYRKLLAGHDWYYAYSDDHSVWSAGERARATLRELRKELDPDAKIWDEIAPDDFKQNKK